MKKKISSAMTHLAHAPKVDVNDKFQEQKNNIFEKNKNVNI